MKNKLVIVFSLMILPLVASAQGTMAKVFESMPDSLLTYLDASQRKELVGDIQQGAKQPAVVVNALGDSSRIVKATADYLKLNCNEARVLELKLLPRTTKGDTVICMVDTYKGPAEESTLGFYDLNWNKLDGQFCSAVSSNGLLQKPDSISDDDFKALEGLLDPMLVKISLSPTDRSLTFKISVPNVPIDKKKQLEGLISQRKLKWNGEMFN